MSPGSASTATSTVPSDTFGSVFGPTISQARVLTHKPVLLSETAVGPVAGQAAKIGSLFAGMRQYQTLGLVWFDIAQDDGVYHQDWRIENSREAQAAFRHGAVHADPGAPLTARVRLPHEGRSHRAGVRSRAAAEPSRPSLPPVTTEPPLPR